MKKVLLFFLFFISFFMIKANHVDALEIYCDYKSGNPNNCDHITISFSNENDNTTWEVRYKLVHEGTEYPSGHTWNMFVPENSVRAIQLYVPDSWGDDSRDYRVHWATTCVDPVTEPVLGFNSNGILDEWYWFVISIDPRDNPHNPPNYPSWGNGQNLGTVQWTGLSNSFSTNNISECFLRYELGATVFVDKNGDGNRDRGEGGYNTGNQAVEKFGDSFEDYGTNSNGYVEFYNLPPRGDYGLKLNVPNGFECTTSNNCRVGCQSQGCGSGITLGPSKRGYEFGIRCSRPDLIVTNTFNFPGGVDTGTSDPTIAIRNIGYATVRNDFDVTITNRANGTTARHTVTQDVSPGETINLSNASEFQDMPRPPGDNTYTATARVDAGAGDGNVTECNENNNTETDNYQTQVPRPDLIIRPNFEFQGGNDAGTTNPFVAIENIGTATVTRSFVVRVMNRSGGDVRNYTVTNDLAPGDRLTLCDPDGACVAEFQDMRRPPAGDYTARAIVDARVPDDINELNENNNVRTDDYRTRNVPAPDLRITSFTYPNGNACGTGNVTIVINNRGDAPANNFVVRVNNGNGDIRSWTVTTALAGGDSRDLSGRFTGMALPNQAGNQTATAIVDYGNRITNESNEGNNTREDDYVVNASACATYSIQGGVYIENLPLNYIKNTTGTAEPYVNATNLRITGANGFSRTFDSDEDGFSILGLSAANNPYTISYPDYATQYPNHEPSEPRVTAPTLASAVTVNVGPSCGSVNGIPLDSIRTGADCNNNIGNVTNLDLGIYDPPPQPWLQSIGGDVRADHGIDNEIPDTNPATYFSSANGTTLSPGIVFGSAPFDLGAPTDQRARIANRWLVSDEKFAGDTVKTSYDFVKSVLEKSGQYANARDLFTGSNPPCTGTNTCNFSAANLSSRIYKTIDGKSVRITGGDVRFSGGSYVFLIDGSLRIENNITVDPGSIVIFLVKGNITVSSTVDQIAGIYSAGVNFTAEGSGPANTDTPLAIYGNVITNSGLVQNQNAAAIPGTFRWQRNSGSRDNNANPVVRIFYRPDFILNTPDFLRGANFKVQEVAPGSSQ